MGKTELSIKKWKKKFYIKYKMRIRSLLCGFAYVLPPSVYTPTKTIRSYANHLVGYITDDRGVSCSLPKPDQTLGKCQVCDGHGPLV